MLEKIKKIDKKVLTMMGLVIGLILILVIAVIVVAIVTGGKLSYSKIEKKMITASRKYYNDNNSALPSKIGESVEVDVATLVSGGYIKDLSEYTDEDVVCDGKVMVSKVEKDYDYVASLDCGDAYKTKFLYEKLIKDTVSTGSGLYKMEDVVTSNNQLSIDDDGYDLSSNELMSGYIYRGEMVNNYIKIDDVLYQIVKIDGNNDFSVVDVNTRLRGVFDNRYNSEIELDYGMNDYSLSRVYENLKKNYDNISSDKMLKLKAVSKNICIGQRDAQDNSNDGSAECSNVMKEQYFGLLPMFDIMNASLDSGCTETLSKECMNYNYLVKDLNFWTMTPAVDNTYSLYKYDGSSINVNRASTSAAYKTVYYLSNRLIYEKGTGTENDPYIVK